MGGEVVTHAAAGRLQGVEEAGISEVYKGQRTTASPHSIYVTSKKKKKKNGPFEKIPTSGETLEPHVIFLQTLMCVQPLWQGPGNNLYVHLLSPLLSIWGTQ